MSRHRFHLSTVACTLLLGTSLAANAADPANTTVSDKERLRHEGAGISSGALVGGLLGGPFGFIGGAALGAWVSDKTVAAKERDMMATALDEEHQSMLALQAQYRALEARYQVAMKDVEQARQNNAALAEQSRRDQSRVFACCSDSELDLHFKTNSTAIEPHYQDKLAELAKLARELPNAVVEITGHADRRGDADANLALSQRRIQAVRDKLRALGVAPSSLQASAYGESRPLTDTDTLENNFFDRRVVVKVTYGGSSLITRTND